MMPKLSPGFGSAIKQLAVCTGPCLSLNHSVSWPFSEQRPVIFPHSGMPTEHLLCAGCFFLRPQHRTVNKINNCSILTWPTKLFSYAFFCPYHTLSRIGALQYSLLTDVQVSHSFLRHLSHVYFVSETDLGSGDQQGIKCIKSLPTLSQCPCGKDVQKYTMNT